MPISVVESAFAYVAPLMANQAADRGAEDPELVECIAGRQLKYVVGARLTVVGGRPPIC
jgi:hypothetical protein